MIVKGNISKKDFPMISSATTFANKGNVNIFIRMPGPIVPQAQNSAVAPGTIFGTVTGGKGTTANKKNIGHPIGTNFGYTNFSGIQDSLPSGEVAFDITFGQTTPFWSQGVVLVKVTELA